MDTITLDPETRREVIGSAQRHFDDTLTEIVNDMGEAIFTTMDWQDLAQLFYLNGFINGCIATATSDDFRESVTLMNDEIAYQTKQQ